MYFHDCLLYSTFKIYKDAVANYNNQSMWYWRRNSNRSIEQNGEPQTNFVYLIQLISNRKLGSETRQHNRKSAFFNNNPEHGLSKLKKKNTTVI